MIKIEIFYKALRLVTQTVTPTFPDLQGINRCIQYLASHHHKPILYPSNYHDGSNFIRLTWNGNQSEDYTTLLFKNAIKIQIMLEFLNRRRSVSGIIRALLGVSVFWKVQNQPYVAYDSTDGKIRYVYKDVKKTNSIQRYMEALALHTGVPTVHW